MKFTRASIDALTLPAGKADHVWWDPELPGFGIRLRGDARRWVIQYRFGARQRRESLGDPRKVALDAARAAARQRFAQLELGIDPAAERDKARAEAQATRLTLALVSARYIDAKRPVVRPATTRAVTWHLTRLWAPLRNTPVDQIKRADVAARIGAIVEDHGRISATRARASLSAMYSWAMREGLCEANPVVATNNPSAGIASRDRTLFDHELRAIWAACGDDDFGRIVRLLILTGCRRTEVGSLRWGEVDLATGAMTIPGARTKNRRPLELTLAPAALDILRGVARRGDNEHMFGRPEAGFNGWSYSQSTLNLRIAETEGRPLARWVLHDIRRTVRTNLGRLGVAPHVAELVLGHHVGGVQAVYDRHRYQGEVAAALALWAAHVAAVVEGGETNVVALRT